MALCELTLDPPFQSDPRLSPSLRYGDDAHRVTRNSQTVRSYSVSLVMSQTDTLVLL